MRLGTALSTPSASTACTKRLCSPISHTTRAFFPPGAPSSAAASSKLPLLRLHSLAARPDSRARVGQTGSRADGSPAAGGSGGWLSSRRTTCCQMNRKSSVWIGFFR